MQQVRTSFQVSLLPHLSLVQVMLPHTALLTRTRQQLQVSPCRTVYEVVDARDTPTSGTALTTRVKKLDFDPFVKDLFVGKFNKSMLSYAEVLNYERHRELEAKVKHISSYLETREESLAQVDMKKELPPEVLHWCKAEGMYGLALPRDMGGQDYLATEVTRMLEEMGGKAVSLAEYLQVSDSRGYRAIVEYGSEAQKDKYLPPLSAGEYLASFCVNEESAGSDPSSTQATAKYDPDTDTYTVQGRKTWVPNAGSAKVFTVLANTTVKNYLREEETLLTAFLVEKSEVDDGGVTVGAPYPVHGYSPLQFSDVTFNCRVPATSILGEAGQGLLVLNTVLHHHKFMVAAGVVPSLRKLLNETVEHCNTRKQFGLPLSSFSLVKMQVARMAGKLYALESMLYLTAGLVDISECPDVELESVIVKLYAAETSDYIVKTCLSLLGREALLETSKHQHCLSQNQFLAGWQGSANILKAYLGISGVMHLVQALGPAIHNTQNPLLHPVAAARWSRHTRQHRKDQAPLTHKLSGCVHPRMVSSADRLEWVVEKIPFLATNLVHKHVSQDVKQFQVPECHLVRLAELVTEAYAMTCTLSRANRSYIVGNLHGEHEINIAIPYISEARLKCKQLFMELQDLDGEEDYHMNKWVQNGLYFAENGYTDAAVNHPLNKRPIH